MADIQKGELQDNLGNTIYPHTEADVVFMADGQTAQQKITKYENALGSVTGKTDSLETNNTNILATSKAVNTLKTNVAKIRTYVGSDGKLHFVDSAGADSVLPFKSGIDPNNTLASVIYQNGSISNTLNVTQNVSQGVLFVFGMTTPTLTMSSGTHTLKKDGASLGTTSGHYYIYEVKNISAGSTIKCNVTDATGGIVECICMFLVW